MTRRFRSVFALVTCLLAFTLAATAQAPKVGGDYYEDEVDLGFKIKCPKGWNFIPSSPMERNLIGKYAPPHGQYVELGGGAVCFLNTWLVKFDARPEAADREREVGGRTIIGPKGDKDIHEWIKASLDEGRQWSFDSETYPKPLKGVKIPAEYYVFEGMSSNKRSGGESQPLKLYVGVYTLSDELTVAFAGVGPGDKKWRSYESSFSKMAKSFRPVEVERPETEASGPMSLRDRRRAELEKDIATAPGWHLHETPNYFIVYSNDDTQFIKELADRLEAIRAVYEDYYPREKARAILQKAAEAKGGGDDVEAGEADAEQEDERSVSAVDTEEMSRCSVVRVCKNQQEYSQYGGPSGSAGYWYWVEEELVIYDDKAVGGRDDTWITLNHEAFHQYIFYFYGNISPHYWFNEGTGDFYSGYEYSHKRFKLKENSWRVRTIQQMIREENYAPLKDFVRYGRPEYYDEPTGTNPHGLSVGQCYAQGWALVWFLRNGKKKAAGWNDDWDNILDSYLETLVVTGDLDAATDATFAGIDWEEFESCWKNYIK